MTVKSGGAIRGWLGHATTNWGMLSPQGSSKADNQDVS